MLQLCILKPTTCKVGNVHLFFLIKVFPILMGRPCIIILFFSAAQYPRFSLNHIATRFWASFAIWDKTLEFTMGDVINCRSRVICPAEKKNLENFLNRFRYTQTESSILFRNKGQYYLTRFRKDLRFPRIRDFAT